MAEGLSSQVNALVQQRVDIEQRLQNEKGELSRAQRAEYERAYSRIEKSIVQGFKQATSDSERISFMLELMRILENRLVYLQNFDAEPSADHRMLAALVMRFIEELSVARRDVMSNLESTYYRAIGALYAGDIASAKEGFHAACESEESDEANDIKYKSYVILGHLSHHDRDYEKARILHDKSLQYSHNANVTAQALAFKALNAYALHDYDEALNSFEESLTLFDADQPFFNSYFHRNALIFSAAIHFDRKNYAKAEEYYRRILGEVEPHSYDHFDALSHLGKIYYSTGRFDEAAATFTDAVTMHRMTENEYLVDTYFWLARTHLKRNDQPEAKKYLEKITASEIRYDKKAQAAELLQRIA
jgi:tetratricopeptide (TPR) repeat protein